MQKGYAGRAWATIQYNKVDISESLKEYLLSVEYTDELTGKADDLQLTLEDPKFLWLSDWFPEKGSILQGSIITKYWNSPIEAEKGLDMGLFEIDEIEASGAPNAVKIKAVSVPNNTTLRGTVHTKQWEKITIEAIAKEKADNAKLQLVYQAEENPVIDRIEQTEQSDLAFLNKLCIDNGLALKITAGTMVIMDEKELENEEPVICFIRPGKEEMIKPIYNANNEALKMLKVSQWSFSTSLRDIYKDCRVEYQKGKQKEKIVGTFADPQKKEGKTLLVKEEVSSKEEAIRKAKKALRDKNKNEISARIQLKGDTDIHSGLTVQVKGFGKFDGKYLMTSVKHRLSGGYTCDISMRRCLVGY